MKDQKKLKQKGATMRLGVYPCEISKGTLAYKAYKNNLIYERHRHRFEFNNKFKAKLANAGLVISGIYKNKNLVEIIEVKNHPWFVGVQFHPEFQSCPTKANPLFRDFIAAALKNRKAKGN
jgi:CTP synthase